MQWLQNYIPWRISCHPIYKLDFRLSPVSGTAAGHETSNPLDLWICQWNLEVKIYSCRISISHLAQILRWSESGGFASVFGFLWYFWFFFFFLQDFFFLFLFFRHFLAFLSLASSSLLSLERPIIGTVSCLPSFISSLVSIFRAKWQDSFFGDGTLWRTSIWKRRPLFEASIFKVKLAWTKQSIHTHTHTYVHARNNSRNHPLIWIKWVN